MEDYALISIFSGASFVFLLGVIGMTLWAEDRKKRREHEERMLALQRGLLPPDWAIDTWRNRRRAWLVLCLGLPTVIACALVWGTFRLVEAMTRSGQDFRAILLVIWLMSGAVALASVIVGGLGLLDEQRWERRQRPSLEVSGMNRLTETMPPDRGTFSEHAIKQERP
jgi:hypothetical protein